MQCGPRYQDLASMAMAFGQNHSLLQDWVDWPLDATRSTISFAGLSTPNTECFHHEGQSQRTAVSSGFIDDSASPSLLYSHGTKINSPVREISNELDQPSVNTWERSAQGTDDGLGTTVEDDVILCHEKKVAKSARCTDTAPASPKIKQEPSACHVRQQTLRLQRRDQAIQQSRADDSSVASVDPVRIDRWPPQYISPPPSSQKPPRRSTRKSLLDSPSDDGSDESSQPLIKRSRKNDPVECNANRPISGRHPRKASAQQKPSRQPSAAKKLSVSRGESKGLADTEQMVNFFFFAGDQDFGALPASMKQCKAAKSFFDKAALAASLSSSRINEKSVRAVTVAIDGFDWPLVIPWRDADGFRIMMQNVGDLVSQGVENLSIKVTCIAKR